MHTLFNSLNPLIMLQICCQLTKIICGVCHHRFKYMYLLKYYTFAENAVRHGPAIVVLFPHLHYTCYRVGCFYVFIFILGIWLKAISVHLKCYNFL